MMAKINSRNQITLPQTVLEKMNIKAGDRLLVEVQDGLLILIPHPEGQASRLQGLHSEIWKDIDIAEYLNGERGAW